MIPTPVLITFVMVLGIIGAAYYFLILKPEDDEQRDLRRRLKTSKVAGARAGAQSPRARR